MSNRFHSKFHRSNHHTYTNSANPDAGHDPIASPENPFKGDFVLQGGLSALVPSTSAYSAAFLGAGVGIGTITPNANLTVVGNISATDRITIGYNNKSITTSSVLGGSNNQVLSAYSIIGGGNGNIINSSYSFIGAGSYNYTNLPNTFILGTGLSASQSNFAYVNNLSSQGVSIANASWANSVYSGVSGDGIIVDYLQGAPGLGRISVGNGTGNDSLAFYSNGPAFSTPTLYLSSNGYVGINTNSPSHHLAVVGSISGTKNLYIDRNGYISGSVYLSGNQFLAGSSNIAGSSYISGSQNLSGSLTVNNPLYANSSQYLSGSLFSKGNVSINTLDQTNALTVQGNISASGTLYANNINVVNLNATNITDVTFFQLSVSSGNALQVGNNFGYTPLTISGTNVLINATDASLNTAFYVTASKLVGINTNKPVANLTVQGTISSSGSISTTSPLSIDTSGTLSNNNISDLSIIGASKSSVYSQIQNITTGLSASTDISIYNDKGNYLDIGINNSQYNGSVYSSPFNIVGPNDSYMYNTSANLAIGTSNSGSGDIVFFSGGTSTNNERMRISNAGSISIGTSSTKLNSILVVNGDITVNGNIIDNSTIKGAVVNGSVRNIILGSAGQGYSSAPTITIDAPTDNLGNNIQATATCTISNGAVNSITITNPGRGYIKQPNITITGGTPTYPAVMWAMADVRSLPNHRARSGLNSYVLFSDGRLYGAGYSPSIPNGYDGAVAISTPVNIPFYAGNKTNTSYFIKPESYIDDLSTPAGYQNVPAGRPIEYWNVGNHLYVLDSNGNLWSGGSNTYGELGIGSKTSQTVLKRIVFSQSSSTYGQLLNTNNQIVRFAVSKDSNKQGYISCIALAANGGVYTWGYNGWGQLGTLNTISHTNPVCLNNFSHGNAAVAGGMSIIVDTPTVSAVPLIFPSNYKDVFMVGDSYTSSSFVLMNNGTVMAAGYNAFGQLGIGTTTNTSTFTTVSSAINGPIVNKVQTYISAPLSNVIEVHGNSDGVNYNSSTYFLCKDGTLWSTGYNGLGALGLGDTTQRSYATKITTLSGITKFRTATRAGDYAFCVASDGTNVWTWGRNDLGQLATNGTSNGAQTIPFLCNTIPLHYVDSSTTTSFIPDAGLGWTGLTIKDIAIGQACFAILTTDGRVYASGYNSVGQLGLPNGINYTPNLTHVNIPSDNAVSISISGYLTDQILQIITSSGKVYACGYNGWGNLGNNTTAGYYYLPTQVYTGL